MICYPIIPFGINNEYYIPEIKYYFLKNENYFLDVSCSDDDVVEIAWVLVHQDLFSNPDTTVDFLCDLAQMT